LADEIGARCCVNVTGSRGAYWDGPDPADLTPDTFYLIVETTRAIIDAVKPTRTFYTLETMPWSFPDSTASYVRLMQAIDRRALAVHFDPVNLVSSPQLYYSNATVMREFVAALGGQIKSDADRKRAAEIIAAVCGQRLHMRNEQFGFPLNKIQLAELDRRAQTALYGGK
jgi:hypothetical protein